MFQPAQGIPDLPDLTHPQELLQFGNQLLGVFLILLVLLGLFGIAIALFSAALRRDQPEQAIFIGEWVVRYSRLLRAFQHASLVLVLLVVGFFLCSTLANRYHHWEQARVSQVAASVAGDRLEQLAPQMRYVVEEPYSYDTYPEGRLVRVQDVRLVNRFLSPTASTIQVTLAQATDPQNRRAIYLVNFDGTYTVENRLPEAQEFFFEFSPPNGYSLLQNFVVEREGTRLQTANPNDYSFPLRLQPGETTRLQVKYGAQSGPRWIYNAGSQLLSQFRLTLQAQFPNAEFASGIVPTERQAAGRGTIFTWVFDENVAVQHPFGVFTATESIRNTGILPRLLLLAPAIFLWWLLLLYLSIPVSLRQAAIAAGLFFACLLALTYLSRLIDPKLAWLILSIVLLGSGWSLGRDRQTSLAAFLCTIAGAALPVFGLLVPLSGLTLSLAGLLSGVWLVVQSQSNRGITTDPLIR